MGIKNELKSAVDRLDLLEEANNTITKHMNECVEEAMNFKVDESVGKQIKKLEKGVRILTEAIPIIKKIKEDADLNKDGKVTIKEGVQYVRRMTENNTFKFILVSILSFVILQLVTATVNWAENGSFDVGVFTIIGDASIGIIFSYVSNSIKKNDDTAYGALLEDFTNAKEEIQRMKLDHANELHDKDIVIAARDTEIMILNHQKN